MIYRYYHWHLLRKRRDLLFLSEESLLCLILLLSGDIETCPSFLNMKGFSVFHQNIRGLHGKNEIISDILYNNSKIDIFPLFCSMQKIRGYAFQSKTR